MTHLSAQISHLVAARPMAVTMGNAIRQLKLEISGVDIDLPEQDVSVPSISVLPPDGTIVG
jgi:translation initiation factor eIF-2B subunit delta